MLWNNKITEEKNFLFQNILIFNPKKCYKKMKEEIIDLII